MLEATIHGVIEETTDGGKALRARPGRTMRRDAEPASIELAHPGLHHFPAGRSVLGTGALELVRDATVEHGDLRFVLHADDLVTTAAEGRHQFMTVAFSGKLEGDVRVVEARGGRNAGKTAANFTVLVYSQRQVHTPMRVRCELWSKAAPIEGPSAVWRNPQLFGDTMGQGDRVSIVGSLRPHIYEARGAEHTYAEVVVSRWYYAQDKLPRRHVPRNGDPDVIRRGSTG